MPLRFQTESRRLPAPRRGRVALTFISAIFVYACHSGSSTPPEPTPVDADADGVIASLDCDDGNAALSHLLPFAARDRDGDAYMVAESGSVCAGTALPAGYFAALDPAKVDCDDASATAWRTVTLYQDADSDGLGTGNGQDRCIGANAPAATSFTAGDCNDNDAAIWAPLPFGARDEDGDGKQRTESGTLCTAGTLPLGYFHAISADLDCDDHDASKWRVVALYRDIDGDGVGGGRYELHCIGNQMPIGYSMRGYDPLDTLNDPDSAHVSDFDLRQIYVDPSHSDDLVGF
jgi:hypothetical protein